MAKKSGAALKVAKNNVTEALDEVENNALAKSGEVLPASQDDADFYDPKTGELIAADAVEAQVRALGDSLAALEDVEEDDFVQEESDLWKPEKVGDEIRGRYLGRRLDGDIKRHFFACLSRDTREPMLKKVNDGVIIRRELTKIGVGRDVLIRYDGMSSPKQKVEKDGTITLRRTKIITVKSIRPKGK